MKLRSSAGANDDDDVADEGHSPRNTWTEADDALLLSALPRRTQPSVVLYDQLPPARAALYLSRNAANCLPHTSQRPSRRTACRARGSGGMNSEAPFPTALRSKCARRPWRSHALACARTVRVCCRAQPPGLTPRALQARTLEERGATSLPLADQDRCRLPTQTLSEPSAADERRVQPQLDPSIRTGKWSDAEEEALLCASS